jgi:hypothetical protein
MSPQELDEMAAITRLYPSLHLTYDLATALVLNGQPDEARFWLRKFCKIADEKQCRKGQLNWEQDTRMAEVKWPK